MYILLVNNFNYQIKLLITRRANQ